MMETGDKGIVVLVRRSNLSGRGVASHGRADHCEKKRGSKSRKVLQSVFPKDENSSEGRLRIRPASRGVRLFGRGTNMMGVREGNLLSYVAPAQSFAFEHGIQKGASR